MTKHYINTGGRCGKTCIQAIQILNALLMGNGVRWATLKYHEDFSTLDELKECANRHKGDQLDAIAYMVDSMLHDKEGT